MPGVGKGSKPSPLPASAPPKTWKWGRGKGEREGEEIGRSEIACKFIAERILDSKEGGKGREKGARLKTRKLLELFSLPFLRV